MSQDAKYVALAKAIAQQESGGVFTKYGDANTSYGLGQWNNGKKALTPGETPANWKEHAGIVLGDRNAPMTPINQKTVLTGMVKKYATEGLQPYQIAAKWNSGSEKGWENKRGTTTINGQQVAYDVPSYVRNVDRYFKQYSSQIPQDSPLQEVQTPAYPAPQAPSVRANKISQYTTDARASALEAQKANSLGGMAKSFGKALVTNLAGSEVGLGKTIAQIAGAGDTRLADANRSATDTQVELSKRIRANKAMGKDTTRLEQAYNEQEARLKGQSPQEALPSTNKVVGQLAGTALDALSVGTYGTAAKGLKTASLSRATKPVEAVGAVIPELGQIAKQKSAGLLTKRGLGNVATGAGIGYGYDVTQGLQGVRGEDRTGAKAFIPGVGTALGASLPLVAGGVRSVQNALDPEVRATNLAAKRHTALSKLDTYKTIKTATEKGRERGIDIKKVLAETDVLHGAVDKTGTISTKGEGGAIAQYTNDHITGNEKLVSDVLKKDGNTVNPDVLRKKLDTAVLSSGLEGEALTTAKNKIKKEMAGYMLRADKQGNIPLSTLHDAKVNKYNGINFFTDNNVKSYDKAIARTLKQIVEENTTSVQIKEINKELSKHYAVLDYLDKLDNKKVDGGKLGKYFASTIGSVVGSHFGPLGAVAGAEAGSRIKGNTMSRVFNGKTGKVAPEAQVFTDTKKYLTDETVNTAVQLPQSSSKSGNLNQSQSATRGITISSGIPQKGGTSLPKAQPPGNPLKGKIDPTTLALGAGLTSIPLGNAINNKVGDMVDGMPETPHYEPSTDYAIKKQTLPSTNRNPQIVPPSDRLAPVITQVAKETGTDPAILKTILLMESSMAYDDTNKNPRIGKYAWIAGLTNSAKKDLVKAGIAVDYNSREGALKAVSDFWKLLQKRYPNKTPEQIYFDHYYAGPNDSAGRKKLFANALAGYSQ